MIYGKIEKIGHILMKLREYLNEHGTPISVFARRAGVSEATIHNILDGNKDLYLSVALRIQKATKGQVTCEDLISEEIVQKGFKRKNQQKTGQNEEEDKGQ
jgi:DNA-binding transcriptional regulator YdaS (Cro superfamily)